MEMEIEIDRWRDRLRETGRERLKLSQRKRDTQRD